MCVLLAAAAENRFMPPQPRAKWHEDFQATQWSPGCIQVGDDPDVPKVQSEDCLTVNVWAPADYSPATSYPTMVFIFGGYARTHAAITRPLQVPTAHSQCLCPFNVCLWACSAFVEGSNRGPFSMYDSSYIAADQPVVVATCNYRLGELACCKFCIVMALINQ